MTPVLTVLEVALPVFAIAAVGFAWVRLGFAYDTAFVTRLAMTLAVPCLVFTALAGAEIDRAAAGRLLVAAVASYAVALAAAGSACAALRLDVRTYLAPLVFGNTGNLGLPLALFAFGETGLAYAVVVFSVTSIGQFTLGLWIVAGGGNPLRALREPMVAATLLGGLVLWRGWSVPSVAMDAVGLVGQMGIPLMLLTLGVAVARLRPASLARPAALAVLKLVICGSAATVIGLWLQLEGPALGVLVLQLATPVAVTSYLLAEKYGADAQSVAGLVVVSTALSVAALPAILSAFV